MKLSFQTSCLRTCTGHVFLHLIPLAAKFGSSKRRTLLDYCTCGRWAHKDWMVLGWVQDPASWICTVAWCDDRFRPQVFFFTCSDPRYVANPVRGRAAQVYIRWYTTDAELRLCTWGRTNTRTRSCWSTDSPRRLGQKPQVFRQISSCCLLICKPVCAGHLVSCGQAFVSSRVCFSVPCKSYKCFISSMQEVPGPRSISSIWSLRYLRLPPGSVELAGVKDKVATGNI